METRPESMNEAALAQQSWNVRLRSAAAIATFEMGRAACRTPSRNSLAIGSFPSINT
eukprot:CAMPEP_0168475284 /NCGR_PEP_ID=MMETSP0228-20121227/61280_1 /TAXON_ID=133427 /ORGANISM="Protoceratium reticulatum, Strain CCCM 535 (=CCMP 1889)" /LENGTH=56 /DNA_ID=CAMNT_0008491343 /DNA_START=254 /DNA_END=424 /DNA_ORIENTATION=-